MNILTLINALPGAAAQGLIWGIMAIGVYLTFRILDVADLTVDGTMCTGGAVCVMMLMSGHSVWVSMLAATGAGMLAGLATGIFHTFMGIPAILAGILTQLGLYSANLKIMGKANQAVNGNKFDLLVSLRNVKNVPFYQNTIFIVAIFIVVLIAILYWFFGTELGCSLRATGCNPNMSRAQGLIWGIMAIGVYLTFRILDVADLTVDGTMCTGGAVCVMMLMSGHSVWVSMLAATGAGMLAGLATGIFHTFMGIPAILAGILTQLGLYSANLKIMGKANQAVNGNKFDLLVSLRNVKNVPFYQNTIFIVAIFIVVLIAILYWFFGTELGCSLRATGCNPNMSRAQGINTDVCKVLGLMISNGLVALSSALLAQYQGFADVNMGRGAIVIGLAAVIIGEAIFGKIFRNFALRLLSVAFGSILYYLVLQTVIWMGIDTDLLKMLSALVVAVFLAVPYWKAKYFSKPVKRGGNK